jgi:peptidoglycan/xylan/chitin deacetylase (PgdA/CDA1 family)
MTGMHLPNYYTALAPFREFFTQGLPILTYHKLGPRPRNARLKGLYVDAGLFVRQLAELRAADFQTVSLDNLASATASRSVVLTFDDGFGNVLEHGLEPLRQNGFRALQFLVAGRLGRVNEWDLPSGEAPAPLMDATQVRAWLAAGHQIGSHTLTHPFLTRLPPAEAREEIAASRRKLEDQFGVAVEHFCYPYGDWNPAVRDLVAEAGYATACTTDFGVNPPGAPPLALKRITARYRSRNWKNFKQWLDGRFSS